MANMISFRTSKNTHTCSKIISKDLVMADIMQFWNDTPQNFALQPTAANNASVSE